MKEFLEAIREHRRKSGLSQAKLAKLAGVGKSAVFDLEHGKESLQWNTIAKILTVLNMTLYVRGPLIQSPDGIEISSKMPHS